MKFARLAYAWGRQWRIPPALRSILRRVAWCPQLNAIRRRLDPAVVRLCRSVSRPRRLEGPLRLHLGCGSERREGYVNIDFVQTSATDFVCDAGRLPYRDGEVDCIETYHMVEHLPHGRAIQAVQEWFRVLRDGGALVIECPDFDATVRLYLAGEEQRVEDIFGLQTREGDTHYWGYNEKRLRDLLQTAGFSGIQGVPPTSHHHRAHPCLRMEAHKPAS